MTARKPKLTVQIRPETLSRARAVAAGMQRRDPSFTLGRLVEEALIEHMTHLEATHNDGEGWPTVPELRPGRRIGVVDEGPS